MAEPLGGGLYLLWLFIYLLCLPMSIFTIFLMGFRWQGRFNLIWKCYFVANALTAFIFSIQLLLSYLYIEAGHVPPWRTYWTGWLVFPILTHLLMFYARSAEKGVLWDFTTMMLFARVAMMVLLLPPFQSLATARGYAAMMTGQAFLWLFGFSYYLILSSLYLRERQTDYSMVQALHLSPFGIWVVSDSGTELFANAKMEEIFSTTPELKLRGRDWQKDDSESEGLITDIHARQYQMERQETLMFGEKTNIWSFSEVTEHQRLLSETQKNSELLTAVNEIVEEMLTSIDKSMQAQEAANMARHIHDVLAQELSIVGIAVETLAAKQESILGKKELVNMIHSLLTRLERRALMQEEEAFSNLITAFAGIGVELVISGKADLSFLQKHSLFLILREAATNAVRHGGANYVEMAMEEEGNFIMIEIVNNGMAYKLDYEEGMGIRGMREKIQRIGGTFAILPEEGFLIRLTLNRSGDFSMD